MAHGVIALMDAEVAVAVTGAGGPDPQDGREPGTVFVAVGDDDGIEVTEHRLDGDPGDICAATRELALEALCAKADR